MGRGKVLNPASKTVREGRAVGTGVGQRRHAVGGIVPETPAGRIRIRYRSQSSRPVITESNQPTCRVLNRANFAAAIVTQGGCKVVEVGKRAQPARAIVGTGEGIAVPVGQSGLFSSGIESGFCAVFKG